LESSSSSFDGRANELLLLLLRLKVGKKKKTIDQRNDQIGSSGCCVVVCALVTVWMCLDCYFCPFFKKNPPKKIEIVSPVS
jgi:hypothetical protein